MKTKILVFAFLLSSFTAMAQVTTTISHEKDAFKAFPALKQSEAKEAALKRMPAVDVKKLLDEDAELEGAVGLPFRFGHGFDVDYGLEDGTWVQQKDKRVWTMRFSSPGAYSLNFIFSKLSLVPGAELYIFNADGSMVYGPVTAEQNISEGLFLTDLVAGDEAVIQLIEPGLAKENSTLRISRVVHGYKNMFPSINPGMQLRTASDCYNDVVCYPDWANESDAVGLAILGNGTIWCSGALLNNTAQDNRAYFLTAFHCLDKSDNTPQKCKDGVLTSQEISDGQNGAFRFRYRMGSCNGSSTISYITYNQAHLRAAWKETDFALMELQSTLITNHNLTLLGWDRRKMARSVSTCLHHAEGLPMKITFGSASAISVMVTSSCVSHAPKTLYVNNSNNGQIKDGASGAPLFNSDKRVIGQFHGGENTLLCQYSTGYYGRIDSSWTGGGTNSTRLSNWLAPAGSPNPETLNTRRGGVTGPDVVPCITGTATYQIGNGASSINWTVSSNLQIVSGQGTNTVNVKAKQGTTGTISCGVTANFTYNGQSFSASRTLTILQPPVVTSITGSSTVQTGGYGMFNASPIFPSSEGSYEWFVDPSAGTHISNYGYMCDVTFNQSGTYMVYCRSKNNCNSPGSYNASKMVTVTSSGGYYSAVASKNSKLVNVAYTPQIGSVLSKQTVDYSFINATTGLVVASGHLPATGGSLDFSAQPAGIYVLQITTDKGTVETFKIILK